MEKDNFVYRLIFEGIPTGIVMGLMLGGALIYWLKTAEVESGSDAYFAYAIPGMVFLLVYCFAGFRLLRDFDGLVFSMSLAIPAIMSAASCSVACYAKGEKYIIPFEQVLLIPLLSVMVYVCVMVFWHWAFTEIEQRIAARRSAKEKRKNAETADAEKRLPESDEQHPLAVDPLEYQFPRDRYI